MRKIQSLIMLFAFIFCTNVFAVQIQGARFFQDDKKARLVLELNEDVTYQMSQLSSPSRVVIDLPKLVLETDLDTLPIENSVIKKIRYASNAEGFRLVMDLNQSTRFSHFMLSPTEQYSYRLVIDFLKPSDGWKRTPELQMTKQMTTAPIKTKRDILVVIDPGHGGKDSGARGPTGTQEKQVVLDIAKKLKTLFDSAPGYRAELTRDGDYYIGLRERLQRARSQKADLFVSIHADAFNHSRSKGASVYAVSERGASSEAAHWLAKKENYSELGRVNLDDKADKLREVLINLSQAMTIAESLAIGDYLLDKIKVFAELHHDNVEQAPFVVLKSPDIPSVLIETGFISNHKEEARLKTSAYQHRLAKAIHEGIIEYFKARPPEDWYITPVLTQAN